MKHVACAVSLLMLACGGNEATKKVAPHAESAPPATPGTGTPSGAKTPATPAEAPLSLAMSVERSNDGVGLHVINRGPATVSLAADVALERKNGESYAAVAGQGLKLRFDCASQGCVSLAPGAELLAPAWLGRPDGERCDALAQASELGSYRFVVRSCGGGQQAEVTFVQSRLP